MFKLFEVIMDRLLTKDIKDIFSKKRDEGEFRIINGQKCVEIQNANFIADKDYILRKPNYDYAHREIDWYKSQSLYVDDIPGETPKIWKQCADRNGKVNSNYGWCIFSEDNGYQYNNCVEALCKDVHTRQAVMIYNRPSMYIDSTKNGMHDFMCTFSTQVFLNDIAENEYRLDYIVNMRSCDAVFGYNNDNIFHRWVQEKLCDDLSEKLKCRVIPGYLYWNAGSLHVYERHFKYLE